VPWQTSYATTGLVGGEVRYVLAASGHVAGVINPPARGKRSHWLNDRIEAKAEDWLARADEIPGSWWPDWDSWIKKRSTGTKAAPKTLGDARHKPTEPAPGSYVKVRID
jgi:polyhydroxyalkanoate synthase subunit PhaC